MKPYLACVAVKGNYSQMNDDNAARAAWIETNGYENDGFAFYIYPVSPHETSDPNEFIMNVCCPVRRKK